MKKYLPILYLMAFLSCFHKVYKSGKDAGSREAMNFSPVLSTGSRFEVYCQLYEHNNQIMNEATKAILRSHIEHAGSEYEKQWKSIENESYFPKYKGLIYSANHYLKKEFK